MGIPKIQIVNQDSPRGMTASDASALLDQLTKNLTAMLEDTAIQEAREGDAAVMLTLIREARLIAEQLAPHYLDFAETTQRMMRQPFTQAVHEHFNYVLRDKPTIGYQTVLAGTMGSNVVRFSFEAMECVGIDRNGAVTFNLPFTYEVI